MLLCALIAALGTPVLAQAPSHLQDRWQVSLAGTGLIYATALRVDAANGTPGTDIDPEDDLGLARGALEPRIAARWRPGRRHELELGYQMARRTGTTVLADTIRFADTSFAAGLRIESAMRSDHAFLTWRYAFHLAERHQLGAAVGLGTLLMRSSIHAIAGTPAGGDTAIAQYESTRDMAPPVGSIGVYGRWQISAPWYVEADARALYLSIDRITVRTLEAGLAGRYFFSDKIAAEIGYGLSFYRLDIDPRSTGRGFNGRVRYGVHDFRLGVVAKIE